MSNKHCHICDGSGIAQRICASCNGSGEGYDVGTRCVICKGLGTRPTYCECICSDLKKDPDDDNDYMGDI